MRPTQSTILLFLSLAMPAIASEPIGSMLQLQQLNRESRQELNEIQQPPANPESGLPQPANIFRQNLNRYQQAGQQDLQERQRRQLLMRNQRNRISQTPQWRHRTDAINRQWQFQLQQQNQLNRFRQQQR